MPLIGFEMVQGCVQATGEAFVTPLAFPILNVFVFAPFSIANQCVDTRIGDSKIITPGIGASIPFGGDGFLAAACALALSVRDDSGVGLQDRQRDPGFATWAVIWGSWFPFSGVIVFAEQSEFPDFSLDVFPMREQQGDRKQQDDDLFSAQGEKIHRIEGLSSRMGADPQILCSSADQCQDGDGRH